MLTTLLSISSSSQFERRDCSLILLMRRQITCPSRARHAATSIVFAVRRISHAAHCVVRDFSLTTSLSFAAERIATRVYHSNVHSIHSNTAKSGARSSFMHDGKNEEAKFIIIWLAVQQAKTGPSRSRLLLRPVAARRRKRERDRQRESDVESRPRASKRRARPTELHIRPASRSKT